MSKSLQLGGQMRATYAPPRGRAALITLLTSALLVALTACSEIGPGTGGGIFSDTENYRPTAASVVPSASCALPDIIESLGYNRSTSINPQYPPNGSIPDGFEPDRVVRCEVAENGTAAAIDEMTLTGDMGAVIDAFNTPSTRYKNGGPSCVVRAFAPVALWLVSDRGAIRSAWPSTDCDLKPNPLEPLAHLTETSRRTVVTVQRFPGTTLSPPCTGYAYLAQSNKDRRPAVRLPEQAVAATTVCGVRVRRLANGDSQRVQTGSGELSPGDSGRLIRAVLAAPRAAQCDSEATDLVAATLRRPDGSGGGILTAELDGCQRISIDELITRRTVTPTIAELLQRAT